MIASVIGDVGHGQRLRRQAWRQVVIIGAAFVLTSVAMSAGFGTALERLIEHGRFSAMDHKASGKLVILEMDAASIRGIEKWPWPRDHHARLVDSLRRMGAQSVVFDVDFSSPSTEEGDAAFADALARANGLVVLPTFSQQAGAGDKSAVDTVPLPRFREKATLASVSVVPDSDGLVREAPFGTMTLGLPRPSLSSFIAGRAGTADQMFPIDYSIRPGKHPAPQLSGCAGWQGRPCRCARENGAYRRHCD